MRHPLRSVFPRRSSACLALAALTLLVASCGGGGGSGSATDYLLINLATGASQHRSAIPDLTTNPAYTSTTLVLAKVPAGTLAGQAVAAHWCAVFELTQGQWLALGGAAAWTTMTPASLVGDTATVVARPAFGLSFDAVAVRLATFNGAHAAALAIPTADQWQYDCLAGSTGDFSWGAAPTAASAANYAVARETAGGQLGAQPAGARFANQFGLYDCHGNLWEWTSDRHIRGGSWNDNLYTARAGNSVALDQTTEHGLVGVRLVMAAP